MLSHLGGRRRPPLWLAAVVSLAAAGAAAAPPPCPGDCDGDARVDVAELVRATRIGLGLALPDACPGFDAGELASSVGYALGGCPRPPTETPTETCTPTTTQTPTITATFTITPTPPLSSRVCGDRDLAPGEECDDGNLVGGDGCDAHCRSELQIDPCAQVTPISGTRLAAVRVASGLSQPLYATSPPGDTERLFIVEQRGAVRILRQGAIVPTPFLDLTPKVTYGGERGLLSLAFHPQYAHNGEFFVDYTTTRGDALISIVSRFRVSADPDVADAASEEIVLEQPQPYVAHNGGQLAFDDSGYLYVGFGDGGQGSGSQNTAQDRGTWLGKILRIDVDGGRPFAVPADNPFVGQSGWSPEIFVMGLRNPWRFSFDAGTLFIGDVGEGTTEEIDVVPPAGEGSNFGWCCREGDAVSPRCFQAAITCPATGLLGPAIQYAHTEGCSSVTGGFVYRGCALPDLRGTYFYADYCKNFVRSARWEGEAFVEPRDWTADLAPGGDLAINKIAGFGRDGRGELYLCDLGGEVFKIVPAP